MPRRSGRTATLRERHSVSGVGTNLPRRPDYPRRHQGSFAAFFSDVGQFIIEAGGRSSGMLRL